MHEPSGLLVPSLRVFPSFVVGRERRAAPQRLKGIYDTPPCKIRPKEPAGEQLPAQCRKGSVAPLVERFEAPLPL